MVRVLETCFGWVELRQVKHDPVPQNNACASLMVVPTPSAFRHSATNVGHGVDNHKERRKEKERHTETETERQGRERETERA